MIANDESAVLAQRVVTLELEIGEIYARMVALLVLTEEIWRSRARTTVAPSAAAFAKTTAHAVRRARIGFEQAIEAGDRDRAISLSVVCTKLVSETNTQHPTFAPPPPN